MFCNKCGTPYPDNGTCPNCSGNDNFFRTGGSLDGSMDMGEPVSYPNPEPATYNEPSAYNTAATDDDYMKTMPYSDVDMNVEPYVPEPVAPSIDEPTWSPSAPTGVYTPPPSTPYGGAAYVPPATPAYSMPVKTSKPNYVAHIIISALIMAIMLFVPILTDGGLMPDKSSHSLIDIFEYITEDGTDMPEEALISFCLVILATIMSVTAFIGSCTRVKPLCIVSSIIGYVSLSLVATILSLEFLSRYEDFELLIKVLFDADYAMFTIFFWIAAILFLVHFIVSCATRSRR